MERRATKTVKSAFPVLHRIRLSSSGDETPLWNFRHKKVNQMPKLVLNESGKRLLRDLKNLKKDPPNGIAAAPIENNIYVSGYHSA